jgi:hypothetical protein
MGIYPGEIFRHKVARNIQVYSSKKYSGSGDVPVHNIQPAGMGGWPYSG